MLPWDELQMEAVFSVLLCFWGMNSRRNNMENDSFSLCCRLWLFYTKGGSQQSVIFCSLQSTQNKLYIYMVHPNASTTLQCIPCLYCVSMEVICTQRRVHVCKQSIVFPQQYVLATIRGKMLDKVDSCSKSVRFWLFIQDWFYLFIYCILYSRVTNLMKQTSNHLRHQAHNYSWISNVKCTWYQ